MTVLDALQRVGQVTNVIVPTMPPSSKGASVGRNVGTHLTVLAEAFRFAHIEWYYSALVQPIHEVDNAAEKSVVADVFDDFSISGFHAI